METAQAMFLRDGYNATTMERLAQAANVSKATLYKYFPDKDELFLTLVKERFLAHDQRLLDELHETMAQALAQVEQRVTQAEVEQSILKLLRIGSERRNDSFYRILVELAFANPGLQRRVRNELMKDKPDLLLRWPGDTAALPPGVDGRALLHLLFVAITGYSVIEDAVFGQERIGAERLAATLATLICAAFD